MNISDVTHRLRPEPGITNSELVNQSGKAIRDLSKGEAKRVDSRLLSRLTETQNSVRSAKVNEILSRLRSGEFLTRDSAESVAEAVLGATNILK